MMVLSINGTRHPQDSIKSWYKSRDGKGVCFEFNNGFHSCVYDVSIEKVDEVMAKGVGTWYWGEERW